MPFLLEAAIFVDELRFAGHLPLELARSDKAHSVSALAHAGSGGY